MGLRDPAFRRRLGAYLFGVAMGFVLLGWFQMHRQRAMQAQRAWEQSQQTPAKPDAGDAENGPPEPSDDGPEANPPLPDNERG